LIDQVTWCSRKTVRYRMNQPRELLGEALDQPQARFGPELSLRVARGLL
jgi:PucR C-terminal helix-turn-helix domain